MMKAPRPPKPNTGLSNMTDIAKLRRWGTALIKAGQKHRDPHMLTAGVNLHLHAQKLGVPHDGDNTADGALGTQAQQTIGTNGAS